MSDVNVYYACIDNIDAYGLDDIYHIPIDKVTFIAVEPEKKQ